RLPARRLRAVPAALPADPPVVGTARPVAGGGHLLPVPRPARDRRAVQQIFLRGDFMTITPVELHHIQLKRGLLGYRRQAVDQLLEEIERSFEETWRERAEYADRIEQLQSELARHLDLEALLRTTLVSAEKSVHELKAQAKKEADLVLQEAHAEGRRVTREALVE